MEGRQQHAQPPSWKHNPATPTHVVSSFNKHCKNSESCQSQVTWKVKFKCQFCLSCPVLSCPDDTESVLQILLALDLFLDELASLESSCH